MRKKSESRQNIVLEAPIKESEQKKEAEPAVITEENRRWPLFTEAEMRPMGIWIMFNRDKWEEITSHLEKENMKLH